MMHKMAPALILLGCLLALACAGATPPTEPVIANLPIKGLEPTPATAPSTDATLTSLSLDVLNFLAQSPDGHALRQIARDGRTLPHGFKLVPLPHD